MITGGRMGKDGKLLDVKVLLGLFPAVLVDDPFQSIYAVSVFCLVFTDS